LLQDLEDDAASISHAGYDLGGQEDINIPIRLGQEEPDELEVDDIKVIHHPNAGIVECRFHFDDYCGSDPDSNPLDYAKYYSVDDLERPWRPFRTRLDFEVAEIMLDAYMNSQQTERMLALIHEAILKPESFTLSGFKDLSRIWDFACETCTDKVSSFLQSFIAVVV